MNKSEIIQMLHWKNSIEEQNKGIELALKEDDLWFVTGCLDEKCYVGNCIKIFVSLDDEKLKPYLDRLLTIFQDLNWPNAYIIHEHLRTYPGKLLWQPYAHAIKLAVEEINKSDNQWLEGLSCLLYNKELHDELKKNDIEILNIVKKVCFEFCYCKDWWWLY